VWRKANFPSAGEIAERLNLKAAETQQTWAQIRLLASEAMERVDQANKMLIRWPKDEGL
jgi:hypothetical protein